MKIQGYTHLITISEAEAKMIQGLLQKEKIPSTLSPTSEADVLAGSAVHGVLPYKVYVPRKLLEKAKQILNLKKP